MKKRGRAAKVRVKGMMKEAQIKCCNVATRHANGDAIEAAHGEGAMRQPSHARGCAKRAARQSEGEGRAR